MPRAALPRAIALLLAAGDLQIADDPKKSPTFGYRFSPVSDDNQSKGLNEVDIQSSAQPVGTRQQISTAEFERVLGIRAL